MAEYNRLISEWFANGQQALTGSVHTAGLTVNELALAYWKHAEQHYRRPDGSQTDEIHCLRAALRPIKFTHGHTFVKDFGPLALKAVRQRMIESTDPRSGRAWCRKSINLHISRLRSMFRWGVEQELIPPSVLHGLQAVRGLQKGRSPARETEPVRPVPETVVQATLPYVARTVRAMIELQQFTGMRPGEVVIIRGIDIMLAVRIWIYRPGSDQSHGAHKTAWRGHDRVIAIGPQAQEVIKPFLRTDLSAYLFSPVDSLRELRTNRAAGEQLAEAAKNRRRRSKRAPGSRYSVDSYRRAVQRACDQAFPLPESLGRRKEEKQSDWLSRLSTGEKADVKAWRKEHRWHPHQLRHAKATEIRREAGLDAARAVLGHRSPAITETYAELDLSKASEVMERLG
jgi:integrase